jgi:predicted branched-subunit amino acid permease
MSDHGARRADGPSDADIAAARRDLVLASLGFAASGVGFGLVYGLAAREAGFSVIEATAMSVLVLAGAAQRALDATAGPDLGGTPVERRFRA